MNEEIANTEDGMKFIVGATALKRWGELNEIQGAAIFSHLTHRATLQDQCSQLMVAGPPEMN